MLSVETLKVRRCIMRKCLLSHAVTLVYLPVIESVLCVRLAKIETMKKNAARSLCIRRTSFVVFKRLSQW